MPNHFQPPVHNSPTSKPDLGIRGPATALIIVSVVAIEIGALGLITDLFLLTSGAIAKLEEMNDGAISKST